MASTLTEMITEASSLCDEDFDNAQWVAWFNMALADISSVLKISDKAVIAQTDGAFTLPSNYVETIRVDGVTTNLPMLTPQDDDSTGYKALGNTFILQNDDATSITLWYYRNPSNFSTSATSEPIEEQLLPAVPAILLYACAMGMAREDETERHDLYMSQYSNAKLELSQRNAMKRPSRYGQWGVIR